MDKYRFSSLEELDCTISDKRVSGLSCLKCVLKLVFIIISDEGSQWLPM